MTILVFFATCLLIYNFDMAGSWYFVAILVAFADAVWGVLVSTAATEAGIKNSIKKLPGIRGVIDGGTKNGDK